VPDADGLLELLKESVQEVFTTMVFNFCEAAVRDSSDEGELVVENGSGETERVRVDTEAAVDFSGEINGAVVLRCTADGAMDIARGLLMMDAGDALEMEEVADALGECANMMAGSLKTKGLDPHGDFHISVPRVSGPESERDGTQRGSLAYRLEQGLISVEIRMDD